jgi:RND family efflux transporter MFP subunit
MRLSRPLIITVVALGLGGLGIGRAIVARKAEQATLTATSATVQGSLSLAQGDTLPAVEAAFVRSVAISGNVKAVRSAVIKARVSGEVQSIAVREGEQVKRGQVLATLDTQDNQSRLEQARQQADAAKAQWQIAKRTLENNQALMAQGFISKIALDTSASNEAANKATWLAATQAVKLARKSMEDTQLSSPISGLVSKRYVEAGERVNVDAKLLEVVDLSKLEIEASLKPEDVALIETGTQGSVTVEGLGNPVPVRVARINPSATPGTRAISVYLSLKAQDGLRQGLFANGQLELQRATAMVLPRGAVRRRSDGSFVQVVRGGQVQHQAVTLGAEGQLASDLNQAVVEIKTGLKPGEQVLRESLGLVKSGSKVNMAPVAPATNKG